MSNETSLEARVVALEATIAELHKRLIAVERSKRGLEKIAGSFRDEPEFEKVIEYGRAFRYADRPAQDSGA